MMDRKQRAELLQGREVRRFTASGLETRSEDGTVRFAGYASTTGQPYDMGFYKETIARGAFTKTLSENPDVQLLINHEGLPLARTTNGSLVLREDESGLHFEAICAADDEDAARIARKVDAGLIDQCSFAFRVVRQTWDEDYENREITEVSLARGDVSIVNYGANPHTSVTMRSLFHDISDLDDAALAELRDDPVVTAIVKRLTVPETSGEMPVKVHDLELFRARAYALRARQQ